MLDAIRKRTGSIVVKGLMLLLVVSFGAWGVGDYVRRSADGDGAVATVGGVEIPPWKFDQEYRDEVQRVRAVLGPRFDDAQARALGLPGAVIGRLVNQTLVSLATKDLGLVVSDEMIRAETENNKAFRGPTGAFDRDRFNQLLRNAGMSEQTYFDRLRQDLATRMLLNSIANPVAPPALTKQAYLYRNEKRQLKAFTVADKAQPAPPEPDAEALAKFHKDRAPQFTAPEYRSVTYAFIARDELAKEIAVSDADLKDGYENRADEFVKPERRELEQILVADEATAKKARAQATEGKDFLAVAKDTAGMDPAQAKIGALAKAEVGAVLGPAAVDAVFKLPEGGVSDPLKSPLGWHVIKVVKVVPAQRQTLDDVKAALTQQLQREKALDAMVDLANKVDDALGGGATVEEAANKFNLKVRKVAAVDAQGEGPDGKPVADLPKDGQFLATVFQTAEGSDTAMTELGQEGYFVAHVDKVTAPTLRPLDQVKDKVAAAWKAEKRETAAAEAAKAAVAKLDGGADPAAVAKEANAGDVKDATVGRDGESDLPKGLIAAAFQTVAGKAVSARTEDGVAVAKVVAVIAADPAKDEAALKQMAEAIENGMGNDIEAELVAGLHRRYKVEVNQRAVARYTQR